MEIRLTHRRLALLLAAFAVASIAGVAYAAIPGDDGVISGCYDSKTGALRVIDAATTAACAAKEVPLDWNRTGPPGPQGPQGPPGPQGAPGPPGDVRAFARIAANGSTTEENSKGLGSATLTHPMTGVYCLGNLPFQPRFALGSGVAGLAGGSAPAQADTIVTVAVISPGPNFLAICDTVDGPKTTQVRIYVYSAQNAMLVDRNFFLALDD